MSGGPIHRPTHPQNPPSQPPTHPKPTHPPTHLPTHPPPTFPSVKLLHKFAQWDRFLPEGRKVFRILCASRTPLRNWIVSPHDARYDAVVVTDASSLLEAAPRMRTGHNTVRSGATAPPCGLPLCASACTRASLPATWFRPPPGGRRARPGSRGSAPRTTRTRT